MCGITGIFGQGWNEHELVAMLDAQAHRGPDGRRNYKDPDGFAGIGHNRLSIIDLSELGSQPMTSADGRYTASLNGEIYNYLELRNELKDEYTFRSQSDTEVLLAAFAKWGSECLDRLIGMFAFIIWDEREKTAFVVRDRFGVKPVYYSQHADGRLILASEIKALHSAGVVREHDQEVWASYLAHGVYDHSSRTFWKGVHSLPGGHCLVWKNGSLTIRRWYKLEERVGNDFDHRSEETVRSEYLQLMEDSVKLRFRADVPVGINLSGGLDSSTLLGLVHQVQGPESDVKVFTFATGDSNYDELPWVEAMLAKTNHELVTCRLRSEEVPALAADVHGFQDEPFGGLPTLAYAKVFEEARKRGIIVLLDGNGMDEQWAGYDYYRASTNGHPSPVIQGVAESPVRPECVTRELRQLASEFHSPKPFKDPIQNLQYRDALFTKIPRAMRFNDRISMRSSTELREPFLDHRLFELALRQPTDRKISDGTGKKMLREISRSLLPNKVAESPKRPLQTPQREWLRGPLRAWTEDMVNTALRGPFSGWLEASNLKKELARFMSGESDNSFYVWQWISLGLASEVVTTPADRAATV